MFEVVVEYLGEFFSGFVVGGFVLLGVMWVENFGGYVGYFGGNGKVEEGVLVEFDVVKLIVECCVDEGVGVFDVYVVVFVVFVVGLVGVDELYFCVVFFDFLC